MPVENLEEESLKRNPNLEIAQWKYLLSTDEYSKDAALQARLLAAIKENNMAPYYVEVSTQRESDQ